MVQTAVPVATLENTGSHWGVTGAASAHAALADASDSSYVSSTGHASAVLRLGLGPLLRPHVRATAFSLTIRWALTTGAFATPPAVRLLDSATQEWVRVYATATLTPPAVGSPADTTYTIPSNLIRGHRKDGGVYNFGDTGVEIQAPDGASGGATLRIYRCFKELEDVYPFSSQGTDIRVQRTGSTWQIVDVNNAIPGGIGTWTTAPQLGETLDSANVMATAVYLAGFLPNAGIAAKVIGIASGMPQMSGPHIYGDNFTGAGSKQSAYWKTGTVNSPGSLKKIDKLLIRSEDASAAGRAELIRPNIDPLGPNGNHSIDLGWISFQSIRFWRDSVYALESPHECRSDQALLGCYDCHFTGPATMGNGFEMKSAYRGGYIAIDMIDCQAGSTQEHNYYHSAMRTDSQILRCSNQPSTSFYPAHPNPDTTNGGKRIGRCGNQVVGRANWCSGGAHGPPASTTATLLVEDCEFDNTGLSNETALTYAGVLGDIIVRRTNLPNANSGYVLAWVPTGASQQGVAHGFHLNLGQFTSAPWNGSCGGVGQWGGPQTPGSMPQSGHVYHHGNLVIEDLDGTSTGQTQGIRTGGCLSVLVIRSKEAISGSSKIPKIHAYPWAEVNNVWKWSSSGAGPFEDLDFRFEVPPSAASVTAYYGEGTSGGMSNLMGFGSADNPANNAGGAGNGVGDTRLTPAQINGLTVGGAGTWPPWAQKMTFAGMPSGMRVGGLFPNLSPPTDYGPWKNGIYDPGKNTCTPQVLAHTAGDGLWTNAVQSEVLMLGDPFQIQDQPLGGFLVFAPEMTGDPFTIEERYKRGHIELEGASAGGTMDPFLIVDSPKGMTTARVMLPFTIQDAFQSGFLYLPKTMDPFVVEERYKRGHITLEGEEAGGTMDPFEIRDVPGSMESAPGMVADPFTLLDLFGEGNLTATAPLTTGGWASASSRARLAFLNRVATAFALGVQYDNDGANKFSSGRWCRLSVQHRATKRQSATGLSGTVAAGVILRTGEMIAQLFAPIVEGDGALLEIADFIESNLRSVTVEGVTYHVPSTERIGRTSDNRWWQVNTTIPFSFLQEVVLQGA